MAEELLTKSQIQDVIDFSEGLAMAGNMGFYSPWLQNQILNNLNNNPRVPKMEDIKKALANYKDKAGDLQSYMEFMKHWDMIFARTLQSYANILSFDLQVVCTDAFTKEDYESEEYAKDKKKIERFLDSFDYKAEFRKVVNQLLTNEVGYYWFRKTKWGNKGMTGTLQLMPQDRCMITGYWQHGILYDFDLMYFIQPGVDIDLYDPVFKKYRQRVFGKDEQGKYNPANGLSARNGTYSVWTQTSPADGAVCFKMDLSNFNETPFLAPFMKSGLRNDEIEALQYNKDIASAYAILAGEIRLLDNAKSGAVKDAFAISPKTLGAFMAKVKAGLNDFIKAVAMPTENTDMYQYNDGNKDMYNNHMAVSAGTGSGVGRLIYNSDRMSNAELQYAVEAQYQVMKNLYPQFQNFLNYYASKLKTKYHFKFLFDGCAYEFDRDKRMDRLMKMADKGIVLGPSAYASVLGMAPQDFERSLREGHNSGWLENLSMLLNANTMKDGGSNNGRPRVDDSQLTDSGAASREDLE